MNHFLVTFVSFVVKAKRVKRTNALVAKKR